MPGFAWYAESMPGAFYGKAYRPILAEPIPGKSTDERVAELTQAIFCALEEIVREVPEQWYMFRSFWPEASVSV
jgi:KDO2-lipid IV(A) lauroyltransferase